MVEAKVVERNLFLNIAIQIKRKNEWKYLEILTKLPIDEQIISYFFPKFNWFS